MAVQIRQLIAIGIAATALLAGGPAWSAGGVSGNEAASVAPFVAVDPIIVPIIQDRRPMGFLIVEVILDSTDSASATTIKRHMPRLRDGFIQTLNEYAWFEYKLGQVVRPERIEKRLKDVSDWVLGDIKTRILFKQVMVQKKRS